MSESAFKEKVIRDLKTLSECWFIKTQERGRRGTPDLLICLRGKFVAIELKREDGEVTPLQLHTLSKIADAQGMHAVMTPSMWPDYFKRLKEME